ncbi:MAG: hypothetical protein FJ086_00270 [Deltaproteobacteria bacterium]|nr:hypothetical protein [Deltaproteobacteria bacterium]
MMHATPSVELVRTPRVAAARSRRGERGFALIIILGLVGMLTAGAAYTLTSVGREASLQAQLRKSNEAFFAAEAGLSEGRERARLITQRMGNISTYTPIMADLPLASGVAVSPGDVWYDLIPSTPYTLQTTAQVTAGAVDANVSVADRENKDQASVKFEAWPGATDISFRVFLRDDVDESPRDGTKDANAAVWIISVGEAAVPGGNPIRQVVQALVSFTPGAVTEGCVGQKGGCSDKSNINSTDANNPDMSGGAKKLF